MKQGAILAQSELQERLDRGEIFRPGSWDPANIRAAAYDLRVAEDFLIVPEKGYKLGRRYQKGERRRRPVVLSPGEVAFLSTKEKLCMPWDVCANIGIKFGWARQGILVLTGLLVDPGFGLTEDGDGEWRPKNDERLHFLIANVGSNEVVLIPGKDKIVCLQFLHVSEPQVKRYVQSGEDMQDEFFSEKPSGEPGLVFFSHVTKAVEDMKRYEERLGALERGAHQLIYFGVFLVSASILAVAGTFALGCVESNIVFQRLGHIVQRLPSDWPRACALLGLGIFATVIWHSLFRFLGKIMQALVLRKRMDG